MIIFGKSVLLKKNTFFVKNLFARWRDINAFKS